MSLEPSAANAPSRALARIVGPRRQDDPFNLLVDVVRASGLGLARGRVVIPTAQLVGLARKAASKAKPVRAIDLVPGEGDVRIHLLLEMMGAETRVVVRAAVAGLHVAGTGGALRLRLVEPPTFSGRYGGKAPGVLGMIGAFGDAALSSLGPAGIAQTIAQFIGGPLSSEGDVLSVDLGSIPAVKNGLARATPLGQVGALVHVTGARFRPGGLEIGLDVRTRTAVRGALGTLRERLVRR
jgi:hypothetical protein